MVLAQEKSCHYIGACNDQPQASFAARLACPNPEPIIPASDKHCFKKAQAGSDA
jgi:hypothetical protein